MANLNRRRFLAHAASLGATAPLFGRMLTAGALAANTSGYKALVCVFFKGGIDGSDLILPTDAPSHAALRDVRGALLDTYEDGSRRPENLLPIGQADGRGFGLPRELAPIHDLYRRGQAAVVANLGPLIEPTTRTGMDTFTNTVPAKLFSHNDQQSTWLTGGVEGAPTGWGGRFLDAVQAADAGQDPVFGGVATTSSKHAFLTGRASRELVVGSGRPVPLDYQRRASALSYYAWAGRDQDRYRALLTEHLRAGGVTPAGHHAGDLAQLTRDGMDGLTRYNEVVANASDPVFTDTRIGQNLAQIVRTVSVARRLGVSRQVFYVQAPGGFDTHGAQATMQGRLAETATALGEFHAALDAMGMGAAVTSFTASDFGRTLRTNGTGSDHGWGGHHFVMGGAVDGGRIIGAPPPIDLTSERYTDRRGRLIPDISVDQYAATLGRWFGLNATDLNTALPNLRNFAERDLGLFR